MTKSSLALLLAASLLGALVVGCGGGGRPSAEERAFIAKADALCKKAAPGIPRPPSTAGSGEQLREFIPFLDMTADNLDALVKDLTKLDPPEKLRSEVEPYFENLSYMGLLQHRSVEATASGRFADTVRFVKGARTLSSANVPLVEEIGFATCAREGPPKAKGSLVADLKLAAT